MTIDTHIAYDFIAPRKIVFGWGRRRELGALGRTLGTRAFVVCGSRALASQGIAGELYGLLAAAGVEPVEIETIEHEPEVGDVDRVAAAIRRYGLASGDFLLAVGGGAAIDLAKAAAAMATNTESPTVQDYLENVGRGLTLKAPPLPVLAMPTTAGTGAEATRNAVISSYDPPFKKSLRDERIMPSIALVDPELCVSVPPEVTAFSGMDAITQLFESYISRKAQPIPKALAMQGLRIGVPAIVEAYRNAVGQVANLSNVGQVANLSSLRQVGNLSHAAREAMSHAALLSGMALGNSGLGMAHGVAPALGIHCRVPHGLACAVMLPVALRVNSQVCQAELTKLAHVLFRGSPTRTPAEAVETLIGEVQRLCDQVGVPRRLSDLGVRAAQIPDLVHSSRGSSMSGNPRELSDAELTAILEAML